MKIKSNKKTEQERFDDVMDTLLSVPPSEIKKKLKEEKEKKEKNKKIISNED